MGYDLLPAEGGRAAILTNERCPAVLVHGWRSHPGIWNRLAPVLTDAAVPF